MNSCKPARGLNWAKFDKIQKPRRLYRKVLNTSNFILYETLLANWGRLLEAWLAINVV